MIGLFEDDGTRLAITYNGLTLNDPADPEDDIIEVSEILGATSMDAITDPRQLIDGMEAYAARKVARTIVLRGTVRAPTIARLYDRMEDFAAAFDPALASLDSSAFGFLALDFSVPTLDTTNYANGLIPCRYYARTLKPIDPPDSRYIGTSQHFELTMLCRDPRRYLQTTSSLAGSGTAANTKADYPSWPTVTITMSGAGSASYSIANTQAAGRTVYLNLSGLIAADVVVVDMELKKVTINGTENNGIVTGNTQWWWVAPGNNTVTVTNGTNATTSTVWRPAFVL